MTRLLNTIGIATAIFLLGVSPALAQRATVPVVNNTAGQPIEGTAVICVDLTGAYVGCGAGGSTNLTAVGSAAPTAISAGTGKALNVDLNSGLFVDVIDSTGTPLDWSLPVPVTQSGSWTNTVTGGAAAGAAPAGNPLRDGCLAKTSLPTANSDATMVDELCDKYGRRISPSVMRENKIVQETDISGTGETTIVTADATNKLELYCLVLANTNTSNPATATVKDSTAGTTRAKIYIPTGDTRGFCVTADSGIPQAAVNTNWTVTLAGTSPTVSVTAAALKSGS